MALKVVVGVTALCDDTCAKPLVADSEVILHYRFPLIYGVKLDKDLEAGEVS